MYGLKQLILVFLVSLTFTGYAKDNFLTYFNEKLTTFYKENVSDNGLVDYNSLKKDGEELEELVKLIENIPLDGINGEHTLSYLINVYNVLVINTVVENYPIKSVMDVKGFFDTKYRLGSNEMSLDELEKKYIFAVYEENMVHFALVCAAKGCPRLYNEPYELETVNSLTTDNAISFLSASENLKVNGNTAIISSIFDWYENDFDGKKGVIEFINMFSNTEISKNAQLSYSNYDWSLNDWKR